MNQPWYAQWKKDQMMIPVGYRFCDNCHGRTSVQTVGIRATGENRKNIVCNKCKLIILEGD